MVVYAEKLFLINFSALFLCLLIPAKKFGVSRLRHIVTAVFGGAWAVLVFALNSSFTALLIIIGYFLIGAIAFGRKAKGFIMFFAILLLLYASASMLISALGSTEAFAKSGIMYFNISASKLAICFALVLPAVFISERVIFSASKRKFHSIKITKHGKTVSAAALYDSGNLLTEPRSGKSVILVSKKALAPLEPDGILTSEKPLIIPYRSLGHNGVVLGFSADKIILDNKKEINEAVIGISETDFSDGCEALIGGI